MSPSTSGTPQHEKDQINELVKLMVTSEDRVVSDFNTLYQTHFPNTKTVARSPFKTLVHISDTKYFTDTIQCFEMMLERLNTLDTAGKFETTYQQYSVETAITAFRDQVKGDLNICKAV